MVKDKRIKSKNWRIVIPNLREYENSSNEQLRLLKYIILQRLLRKEKDKGLQYYRIALEHHQNGVPHLDILLTYSLSRQRRLTSWDYLLKHGDVTAYRTLNKAIIQYGTKQDAASLSNFPSDCAKLLQLNQMLKDPYTFFESRMMQDPLNYHLQRDVFLLGVASKIRGWSSVKAKIKDMQRVAANQVLRSRPGLAPITRAHVQTRLTPAQLQVYDSWTGYQTIIDYVNQLSTYGCKRPFKSRQLLLVGRPNTGKTTLLNLLQRHYPLYHMDVSHWFPHYTDGVYPLIGWNQFKLKGGMPHTTLLKFLEGDPIDLEYKGGSSLRRDNQLIIMTSNMSLLQHIFVKFGQSSQRVLAQANLGARIQELIIPPGHDLFLLERLLTG